ncbi:MAG: GNAT family N-acetyltransferase [Verrucomicrobiota bacterium]
MNDLILRSKASWGYPDDLMSLWAPDLIVTQRDLAERQFFVGSFSDRLVLVYSLSKQSETACELEDCWVEPELKGTGLGRAIFEDVEMRMEENGWTIMRIVSDPSAAGFYLRMGAERIGETTSKPEGRNLPVFEWRPEKDQAEKPGELQPQHIPN